MNQTAVVCGPGVRPFLSNLLPFLSVIALGVIAFPTAALADAAPGKAGGDTAKDAGPAEPGDDGDAWSDEQPPDAGDNWSGELPPDAGDAWSGELPPDAGTAELPEIVQRALDGRDTTQVNGFTCAAESAGDFCDVSFCVKPDMSSCYYEAADAHIECNDCSTQAGLESCGYEAARKCIPDLVELLGCSAPGTGANTNAGWMALTVAGLFIRRARRSRSAR